MDTRRDFIFVDDLVDVVDEGDRRRGRERRLPHLVRAPTSRSRSCSTRRSTALEHRRSTSEVEVRPRSPDDAFTILLDPSRDAARTSAGAPTTPLEEGVARGDRVLPRVRDRRDVHAPEGSSRTKQPPVSELDGTHASSSSAAPASSAATSSARCSRADAARVRRRRQPALGRARERARRRRASSSSRARSPTTRARASSPTSSTTSSTSRPTTATRARSPTRSPTTSNNLITTLKLFERAQGLHAAAEGRLRGRRLHGRREDVRRGGGDARRTRRSRSTRQPVPDLEDRRRVLLQLLPPAHGLPTVRARFQNVYGPGEILGAGRWRGTPATVWRNVTPTFVYRALKGMPLAARERRRRQPRLHLRRRHRRRPDRAARRAASRATSTTSRAASRRRSASWPRRSTS